MPRNVQLVARLTADTTRFVTQMRAAGVSADRDFVQPLTTKFAYAGALAGLMVGGMAIRMTSEFARIDRAWADVTTLLPTYTEKATDQMYAHVRKFAVRTGNDLEDSINATYRAVSALFTTPYEQSQILSAADTLSKAIKIDLNTAVQLIISSLNAFNMEASQTDDIVDSLTTAIRFGVTTGEEFAKVVSKTLQPAKALGFGLKEVTAAHAALTNAGISSAEAATYQRRALVEMLRDQNDLNDAYKEFYGSTIREAVRSGTEYAEVWNNISKLATDAGYSLFELFGRVQGAQAAVVLTGEKGQEVFELTMQNYGGAAEEAANKIRDTLQHDINQLKASWDETKISLSEGIEIPVTYVVERATEFFTASAHLINDPVDYFKSLGDSIGGFLDFTGYSDFAGSIGLSSLSDSIETNAEKIERKTKELEINMRNAGYAFRDFAIEVLGADEQLLHSNDELERLVDLASTVGTSFITTNEVLEAFTDSLDLETLQAFIEYLENNGLNATGEFDLFIESLTQSVEESSSVIEELTTVTSKWDQESSETWQKAIRLQDKFEISLNRVGTGLSGFSDYTEGSVFWQDQMASSVAAFQPVLDNLTTSLWKSAAAQKEFIVMTYGASQALVNAEKASQQLSVGQWESAYQTTHPNSLGMMMSIRDQLDSQISYSDKSKEPSTSHLTDEFELQSYLHRTGQISDTEYSQWLRMQSEESGGITTDKGMRLLEQATTLEQGVLDRSGSEHRDMFSSRLENLRFTRRRKSTIARGTETDYDDHEVDLWFHAAARALGEEYGGQWEEELLSPLHRELILLHDAISVWTSRDKSEDPINDLMDEQKKSTEVLKEIVENTDPDNGRPIHVVWDDDAVAVRRRTLGWTQRGNVRDGSVLPSRRQVV